MRRLAAALALALATGPPAGALAEDDSDEATDDDDTWDDDYMIDLVPVSARGRLVGRSVVIDARFELTVNGPLPPPGAQRSISLPHDAVITAATVTAAGRSHRLQLVESAVADKQLAVLYDEPTKQGERMSAVRIDAETSSDVATVELVMPRRAHVRLDLTLEVPTCFADDARNFILPETWHSVLVGGNAVTGDAAASLDERCGGPADVNPWIAFPMTELAKRPAGEARVGTYSARLPGKRDIARIEIALAKQLSQIPADLHTAIVVDHSRSVTTDELEIQRAVIAGYLRAAPRSRVQLVGYTRDARTLLPGWMIADHALSRIDRELRALAPRNGSNVDRGLAAAGTLLANASGTRRVIVFTDDRLAKRIHDEVDSFASLLPAGTLVHVVALTGGFGERLMRDDAHELAAIARATGGVAMRADLDDQGGVDALPLARPVTLDNLTVTAPGWTVLTSGRECQGDDQFDEGASCVWLADGTSASAPITVEGFLWGAKITRIVDPDVSQARSLARLLTHHEGLAPDLVAHVQRAAQAVNDAWSLVALWGRGGYGDITTWGTIGTGTYGTTIGHTIDGIGPPRTAARLPIDELRAQLGPAVRACKPHGTIVAEIEITHEEIVDIALATPDVRDGALRDCITERMWDTTLLIPDAPAYANVRVDFQP